MAAKKAAAKKAAAAPKAKKADLDAMADLTDDELNALAAQNAVSIFDAETGSAKSREALIADIGKAKVAGPADK